MRMVRRKKGNKIYFYLQHSFRKQGKVKTVERYLGKAEELSDKDMKIKIQEMADEILKESKGGLYKKLDKIKENFQKEWKKIPESAKKKELEEIAIAFTYNTNAIEGSTITLEETREIIHDKMSPNKPLKDVKETEAHSRVFLNILNKKEEISSELLLKWHKEIFGETKEDIAGRYRDYLVRVGPYLAPDWQEVAKMMNELIRFIKKNRKLNPVELSARTHYKFEKIHPFGDGNGRIGRLLMNQILWHSGYPAIIIEYKKRRAYYRSLQKNEEGFVSYFIRRYLSIHKRRYS
ncbi:Fic family protein [Candidatus Pacearchaeota archaeon]|nr:Fic family protein [Candidatus Pacearchaeota archaeon]